MIDYTSPLEDLDAEQLKRLQETASYPKGDEWDPDQAVKNAFTNPIAGPVAPPPGVIDQSDSQTQVAADTVTPKPAPGLVESLKTITAPEPKPNPAQPAIDKLVAAINSNKGEEIKQDPRTQRLAQAIYAASTHSKLPDSFFAPIDQVGEEDKRNLMRAQAAHALQALDPAAIKAKAAKDPNEEAARAGYEALVKSKNFPPETEAAMLALPPKQGLAKLEKPETVTDRGVKNDMAKKRQELAERGVSNRETSMAEGFAKNAFNQMGGKDTVELLSLANTIDDLSSGALTSKALEPTPELERAFSPGHRLNKDVLKRYPEVAQGLLGKAQEAFEKYTGEGGLSNEQAAKKVDEDYNLSALDAALAQFTNVKQHALYGGSVTEGERGFVNQMYNKQAGASPMEQMVAIRIMLKGLESSVQNGYASINAASKTNPHVKEFFDIYGKQQGVVSPDHPFFKKMHSSPTPEAGLTPTGKMINGKEVHRDASGNYVVDE